MGTKGMIKMEAGRFWYAGEDGNWYRVHLWIQGTELHLSDIALTKRYSVQGERMTVAVLPVLRG